MQATPDRDRLQLATACASALVLLLYAALVYRSTEFGLLWPRGGALTLGLSLGLANAAVWASRQAHRSVSLRFQLAVAGWIWLLLQLAAMVYLLRVMA